MIMSSLEPNIFTFCPLILLIYKCIKSKLFSLDPVALFVLHAQTSGELKFIVFNIVFYFVIFHLFAFVCS